MIRAKWIGATAIAVVIGGVGLVRACDPIVVAGPSDFSYAAHHRPRVFVLHHPLIPAPGGELTLRLAPELPANVTVQHAKAILRNPADGTSETKECAATSANDGAFECKFTLGSSAGQGVYSGFVELSNGARAESRAEYRFSIAATIAPDALIEVRVPLPRTQGLADGYRLDTAFVRDPLNYSVAAFTGDVEQVLRDGMLADPVYRWRDDQLGFVVFMHDAFVTSYYSGLDTRCGKNPWPLEAFPSALGGIEVLGVLHRKAASGQGVEGSVTGSTAGLFRDCAGEAAHRTGLRTFSASMGLAQSPFIAKHEFGHAAFELGDEYTEANNTRNVTPAPSPGQSGCCCQVSGGSGTGTGTGTGTGIGTVPGAGSGATSPGTGAGTGGGVTPPTPIVTLKRCFLPGGPTEVPAILGETLPTCGATNTAFLGANCGAAPDGGCPTLAGNCVGRSAWLGPLPADLSGATGRPNVFPTQAACADAVALARGHPGVEDAAHSFGTCRELCGPNTSPCPCEAEAWIVDVDPISAPTNPADAMAVISAAGERHGGTCAWCVETSLCVRWQRALGNDGDKAWQTCQAPDLVQALIAWLAQIVNGVLHRVVF